MTVKNIQQELEKLDFETALKKLEEIVEQVENNNLEKSIEAFEQGIALKKHLFKKLEEAKTKIEKISEIEN